MEPISPIPIPPEQQWREFRIKRIPAIFFCVGVLAVALLWQQQAGAPAMVGEVETIKAEVITTLPGLLAELNVDSFEKVTKGQVIARVLPSDPEALKASLTAVGIELRLLRARMALDRESNEINYEQLRVDYLKERVELATARIYLEFAENEYHRQAQLFEDKLVSISYYEYTKNLRDARQQEVQEKQKLVEQLEQRMADMANREADQNDPLQAAIDAEEAKLLLAEGPITLRSPIDGVVSDIAFQAGERVMSGTPIVTITAPVSQRIIGFVRQPISKVPKVGDPVEVRKRGVVGQKAVGKVLRVGSDLQMMNSPMRLRGYEASLERGLPFLVSLPEEMDVLPGELVDLRLQ